MKLQKGKDIQAEELITVVLDTFTVAQPWERFISPFGNVNFSAIHSIISQVNSDLYIAPSGDNTNMGTDSNHPLKTLACAYDKLLPDPNENKTIFLAAGTYSPSQTGELFPVYIFENVKLEGEASETTILDAENTCRVVFCDSVQNASIKNLTLINGVTETYEYIPNGAGSARIRIGGGIFCNNSNVNNIYK